MSDVRNPGQFPEQLPLFITAREIKETYNPIDYFPSSSHADEETDKRRFWRDKLDEAHYKSLGHPVSTYESIQRHGVKRPVQIYIDPDGKKNLGQGHHRVASQADIDPDTMIPVMHTSDYQEAIDEDDTGEKYHSRWGT